MLALSARPIKSMCHDVSIPSNQNIILGAASGPAGAQPGRNNVQQRIQLKFERCRVCGGPNSPQLPYPKYIQGCTEALRVSCGFEGYRSDFESIFLTIWLPPGAPRKSNQPLDTQCLP